MSQLIVILFLALSTSAYAQDSCPDFSGIYHCKNGEAASVAIRIYQVIANDIHNVYIFDQSQNMDHFKLNNQWRENDRTKELSKAKCLTGNSMEILFKGTFRGGTYLMSQDFVLDDKGNLNTTYNLNVNGIPQPSRTQTCLIQ